MLAKLEQHSARAVVFILALAFSGCALIGGYSAKSHEQLTSIKASHLQLVDMVTEGNGRAWDQARFGDAADKVDLKFREALEFAKSLQDKRRTANIQLLKEMFEEDRSNIKRKNRLLTKVEAETLSGPSADAYDRAINGECARPSASCK